MKVLIIKKKNLFLLLGIMLVLTFVLGTKEKVSNVLSNNLKPIYSVKTKTNQIALTFDISWGEKNVQPILEILDNEDIYATFFLSSPWAEKNIDLVNAIVSQGHEVGSHGKRHVDLNTLSESDLIQELDASKSVLESITNQKVTLLRPPNGAYNTKVIAVANKKGYKVIQWSVDSLDWKRPGPESIVNNIINGRSKNSKGASPGDILLFHASDSAPDTPNALPSIRILKSKNYELVTVGTLLTHAQESWPPGSSL